jgi:hypothetical protein
MTVIGPYYSDKDTSTSNSLLHILYNFAQLKLNSTNVLQFFKCIAQIFPFVRIVRDWKRLTQVDRQEE